MKKISSKHLRKFSVIAKYSFIILFVFTLLTSTVFALGGNNNTPTPPNNNTPTPPNNNTPTPPNNNTPTPADPGVNINTGIKNPLGGNIDDIPSFITKIIDFVLLIAIPIVALALIYSGFLFVTAVGNSEKLKTAKRTFLYTLIGAAILLGAFV